LLLALEKRDDEMWYLENAFEEVIGERRELPKLGLSPLEYNVFFSELSDAIERKDLGNFMGIGVLSAQWFLQHDSVPTRDTQVAFKDVVLAKETASGVVMVDVVRITFHFQQEPLRMKGKGSSFQAGWLLGGFARAVDYYEPGSNLFADLLFGRANLATTERQRAVNRPAQTKSLSQHSDNSTSTTPDESNRSLTTITPSATDQQSAAQSVENTAEDDSSPTRVFGISTAGGGGN
jgi:hypothetical protein